MRRKVIRMIIIFLLMAVLCSVNAFAITHTVNSFESNNNYTLYRSIQGDSYYAVTLRTSSPGAILLKKLTKLINFSEI